MRMLSSVQSSPRRNCVPSLHTASPMPRTSTLWFVNEPQPLHHVTLVRRFQHMPDGFTARVLILRRKDDSAEAFLPLIKYQLAFAHRSRSWQNTVVRAMGLFWDFCAAAPDGLSARDLFRRFALSLAAGTISRDGDDVTGLLWPSTPHSRAVGLIRSIEAFADWWAGEPGARADIAPTIEPLVPGTGEHLTAMLVWGRLRRLSMLQHIKRKAPQSRRTSIVQHRMNPTRKRCGAGKILPACSGRAVALGGASPTWRGNRTKHLLAIQRSRHDGSTPRRLGRLAQIGRSSSLGQRCNR